MYKYYYWWYIEDAVIVGSGVKALGRDSLIQEYLFTALGFKTVHFREITEKEYNVLLSALISRHLNLLNEVYLEEK